MQQEPGTQTDTRGTWQEKAFEDVIDFREGPGILARDFREYGVPLVRLAGLNRGSSLLEGCDYLDSEAVSSRWSHFQLELGDILLSASASLGRIAVVGKEGVGAVPYTGIIRMRPRDDTIFAPFIRYLLEGPDFQQQAEMVGVGSVIRHFGPMHLRQMTVQVPPLPEQRAIAHVLGTLDDKIELNRRMNKTLEEMARALFKSWFVDFDPARAKMEGHWRRGESLPGLPADLYDLFPDRLVNSELGDIPEGWEVKALILSQKVCAGRIRTNIPTPGYNIQPLFRILPQHTVALRCAKSLELPQNGFLRGNQGVGNVRRNHNRQDPEYQTTRVLWRRHSLSAYPGHAWQDICTQDQHNAFSSRG